MSPNDVSVVLAHGAWADGSSWAKVIAPLAAEGVRAAAAPLPLTSFEDDVAALDRALERAPGPVVRGRPRLCRRGDRGDAQREGERRSSTSPPWPRTRARPSRTCSTAASRIR